MSGSGERHERGGEAGRERLPLTHAQTAMWVRWKYAERSAAFNNPLLFELEGEADVARLDRACAALVDRHDVLRARFVECNDSVVQEIGPREQPALQVHDLASLPEPARERREHELLAAALSAPFDLARGPVYRFALLRVAPRRYLLALNIHHICVDGVSASILLTEIAADYEGVNPPPATAASIEQFLEHEAATTPAQREEAEQFWTRELRATRPRVDFDAIRRMDPEGSGSSSGSGRYVFKLGAGDKRAVAGLAQRTRSTMFLVLLAAFDVLLWRYTGQAELTVVFPIEIRPRALRRQFGCMINYLPLALALSPAMTVAELIEEAVAARTRSRPYKSYPHLDISRIARVHGRPFNAAVTAANFALTIFSLTGLEVRPRLVFSGDAKEDLGLLFDGRGDELALVFEYRQSIFHTELIREMAADLVGILVAMAADEHRRLDTLPLGGDRAFAARFFAGSTPTPEPLFGLFERRLSRAGERIVAVGEHRELSARALLGLSHGVARWLRDQGAAPGDRVAVELSRSPSLLPSMLGIWALGAVYVPLDPELPPARRRFILDDAAPRLVLDDATVDAIAAGHCDGYYDGESRPPSEEVPGDALAYLIYTSGSTGAPKGVEVTRANLAAFLRAMAERLPIDGDSRLLAVTTIGFDISLLELCLPLVVGATVLIYPSSQIRDAFALPELLERARVNVLQATPSLFRMLIAAGWAGKRDLIALAGGEALEGATARVLRSGCKELWNLYGPTETTVWSMVARVEDPAAIELGAPILGTSIELLGPHGCLTPRHGRGELYIRGLGLARGYRGRPELTAERFVELPGRGRAYRTGDVVERRGDDTLRFIGRADRQVKIRGFRVELGEVEGRIELLTTVRKAAVIVVTGESSERALAAFIEPATEAVLDDSQLRAQLAEFLPPYMLPALVQVVRAWPLGPGGKLDRRALEHSLADARAPQLELGAELGAERGAELGPEALAAGITRIYAEVLGEPPGDPTRSLFELGGHSLAGARIVARIRDELSLALSFPAFMADSSLASAIRLASASANAPRERPPESCTAALIGGGFPLPAGSARVLLSDRVLGRNHQNTLGRLLVIDGPLDVERLRAAIEDARARFLLDRVRLEPGAPARAIATASASNRDWNLIELDAPDEEVLALCRRWLETPLEPGRGQLFKGLIVRRDDHRHHLALAAHHAALDGEACARLLATIAAIYRGAPARARFEVAQTRAYVESQQHQIEAQRDTVVAHVRARLHGWRYFELGRTLAPFAVNHNRTTTLEFDDERGLAQASRAAKVGPFALVVALLSRALAIHAGVEEVCLGVVHSLRGSAVDADVFGNLTNVLPVHLRGVVSHELDALAVRAQAQLDGDRERALFPFQALLEAIPETRRLGRPPMFSVLVVEEVVDDDALRLGAELTVRTIDAGFTTNLYDLTVRVRCFDRWRLSFDYNATRVGAATIATIARAVAGAERATLFEDQRRLARDEGRSTSLAPLGRPASGSSAASIMSIIDELLGPGASDRERSFLAAGGDSITATRAAALIHARLGIDARVYDFLSAPSIRALVESLRSGGADLQRRPARAPEQALFFMHEAARCKAAYNIPVALRVEPRLDLERLRAAIAQVVAAEPILRSGFEQTADGVVAILRGSAPAITEHSTIAESAFTAIAERLVGQPFDLRRDALVRVHHFSLTDGADALLLIFHHIVADGVSCGNFLRKLAAAYGGAGGERGGEKGGATGGSNPALDVDPAIREGRLEQLLAEFPVEDRRAALPYARPFPPARTLEGGVHEIQLTTGERRALAELARARGVPASAAVFAAVCFVLHHASHEPLINVGVATMNRSATTADALGLYTNTVVLPAAIDSNELVGPAIERLASELFAVCRYADVPFQDLVGRLVSNPSLGATPLFQVFYNFIDRSIYALDSPALRATELRLRPPGAKFELSFEIHDLRETMTIAVEYSDDVYDRATVVALAELLRRVLRALGRSLDKRVARLLRSVR